MGCCFILIETSRLVIDHFKKTDFYDWAKIENDVDVRHLSEGSATTELFKPKEWMYLLIKIKSDVHERIFICYG